MTESRPLRNRPIGSRKEGPPPVSLPLGNRRDVQGLRALAVLLVVIFHAQLPLPGGFTGVDVFFVISGYFMTRILARNLESNGRVDFRGFYARRIRRLLPALAVVTIVVALVSLLVQAPFGDQQESGASGIATIFFAGNFAAAFYTGFGYFSTSSAVDPFLHMWSLGVEEQFYLFFPAFLAATARLTRGKRFSSAVTLRWVAAISAVSFVVSYLVSEKIGPGALIPSGLAFYMFPTRIWEFGLGAAVALVPTSRWASGRLSREALAALGLALIVVGAFVITGATPFPGVAAILPAFGCALLLGSGRGSDTVVAKLLSLRPITRIGDVSYSWYLWHWPAVVFVRYLTTSTVWIATAAFGSLALAFLSYSLVENPIRHGRSSDTFRRSLRLGALIAVPTAVVCLVLSIGADSGWGDSTLQQLDSTGAEGVGQADGCTAQGTADQSLFRKCAWDIADSRGWIQVVGDSHAGALIDGVIVAGHSLGYSVDAVAGASCSFTPESRKENDQLTNCAQLYHWNLERATSHIDPPSAIVISHDSSARVVDSGGLAKWIAALRISLRSVVRAGVPVLLVEDVPQISPIPTPCRFGVILPLDCQVSRAFSDRIKAKSRNAEIRLAAEFHGAVTVLNPTSQFCNRTRCSATSGDQLLYVDNQHLSAVGSRRLAPKLTTGLATAIRSRLHS